MNDRPERQICLATFGFRGYPNVEGGIEAHAQALYSRLARLGVRTTVIARSEYCVATTDATQAVCVITLSSGIWESAATMWHSFKSAVVAARLGFTVVHIHGIGPALMVPLVKCSGARVVMTHHGKDYDADRWGRFSRTLLKLAERIGLRYADAVIALTPELAIHVQTISGRRAVVIPNGVNQAKHHTSQRLLRNLDLVPGRYIVSVARFTPHKRQNDLIDAFAGLSHGDWQHNNRADAQQGDSDRLNSWKLVLVGNVDSADTYVKSIRALAVAPDIVLAGERHGDELRELYSHAGVFVLPSSYEGLPIAVLEALSYGLPVLLSNIPAHLGFGLHERHYHRTGDVADLRSKLATLLLLAHNRNIRLHMRSIARRYDWDAIARSTRALLDELVSE